MKSLIDTTQNHQFPLSKPVSCSPTAVQTSAPSSCYEPTSVLDLRSSPAGGGRSEAISCTPAVAVLSTSDDPSRLLPVDEWDDSMLCWDLGEKDDSAPSLKNIPQFAPAPTPEILNPILPPFPSSDLPLSPENLIIPCSSDLLFHPSVENPCFDRLQLEQLIRASECVESNDLSLAHAILARLNHQLLYPIGKPLQRAAFYFKEALESLLLRSSSSITLSLSPLETVHKIGAYKAFSELSPIFQFAYFTANQAILEAVSGVGFLHLIDFDIGLGGQWPSFMQEIAIKCRGSARVLSPSLRITAIVSEESMETKLTGDILCSFARELGIRFQIDFVEFAGFETLALGAIRFMEGEAIVVNFSPSIFHQIDGSGMAGFFRFLRRISPRIAVFVDTECKRDASGPPSFRRNFIDGLEFYSVLLESLDATAAIGGTSEQVGRIERFLLRPRIFRSVEAAGSRMPRWRELFSASGTASIPFSEFTESQAECLLNRVPVRGFHVVKRQASMMLCWQGRELVSTSAWRCS